MAFTGNEDHSISYEEASKMTQNYQSRQSGKYIKGHYFGKNALLKILDQEGCVGIRCYYGEEEGKEVLVLVGVDADENDLIKGAIAERGYPCPPYCGDSNDLNNI